MSTVITIIGSSTDWRTRWNTAALIFLVLVVALFALPASSNVTGDGGSSGTGIKVQSPSEIERARNYFTDTVLTTHEGNEVRFFSDMLEGRVVMINVMYTNCTGACPLVTQMLSQVSRDLGDLYGKEIHFVSMTNDPERDSPEALAEFARKQNVNLDGWTFLTGSKQKIDGVIKKIGLYTPNIEEHKAMILIGNTRTGHWQKIRPNIPYQAIAVKLKELAAEV
jgi:cytochrome oxidase Cu insertion factor (SCO1/SenC/PrrC family)